MRDSWRDIVDSVLRPSRSELERCARERDPYRSARAGEADARARRLAECQGRIERARAEVFASGDGVVGMRMTELEREWRMLSRGDADAGLMDVWARIAPRSWIDRKRWRDFEPAARIDAVIALASDVRGVERAEAAATSLRAALAPWHVRIGARIRWRWFERDASLATELLAAPLHAACEAVAAHQAAHVVVQRARRVEGEVRRAVHARHPDRPALAEDLAHAAFVESVWRAAALAGFADPVAPLRDLWSTGYVLAAADADGVTLEMPRLAPDVSA